MIDNEDLILDLIREINIVERDEDDEVDCEADRGNEYYEDEDKDDEQAYMI